MQWGRLQSDKPYLPSRVFQANMTQTYLQFPLQQWGAGNVYLLSSWKVNIAKNPIAVMGL
jgi:hypothetical protein